MDLVLVEKDGTTRPITARVERVLLAGYTGRDREAVMAHVRELEEVGVAPPPRVPMIYEVPPSLLSTGSRVTVNAPRTSGEAEVVFIPSDEGLLVSVGSDHTDREQEAVDVAASKALCTKVVSAQVWRLEDVRDHWDSLRISAWATAEASRRLYQDGTLASFLAVDDLFSEVRAGSEGALDRAVIFGGTLPVQGGLAYADRFEVELTDPILDRRLGCAYDVTPVPAASS